MRFILLFALPFLSVSSFGQSNIVSYKMIADEFLSKNFEQSLVKNIKLSEVFVSPKDSAKGKFISYELNKGKVIAFETITFFYEFYSTPLKYSFWLDIKVGKRKEIISDSSFLETIPPCILQNTNCNLISKDSALKIAIKDSILYQDNLNASLIQEKKLKIFYWLITGRLKSAKFSSQGIGRRRLIEASTGVIKSR